MEYLSHKLTDYILKRELSNRIPMISTSMVFNAF